MSHFERFIGKAGCGLKRFESMIPRQFRNCGPLYILTRRRIEQKYLTGFREFWRFFELKHGGVGLKV
jgi:hypothetical protein